MSVFLSQAIRMGILFRGALSVGEYVCKENVVIGPAVAEAAHWYEQAKQIGMVLAPRAAILWDLILEREEKEDPVFNRSAFVDYRVPLKRMGNLNMWTINWPVAFSLQTLADETNAETPRQTLLKSFYVLELFPGAEDKVVNSINYFDNVMQRFLIEEDGVEAFRKGMQLGREFKQQSSQADIDSSEKDE